MTPGPPDAVGILSSFPLDENTVQYSTVDDAWLLVVHVGGRLPDNAVSVTLRSSTMSIVVLRVSSTALEEGIVRLV